MLDWLTILANTCIALGAILMLLNIIIYHRTTKEARQYGDSNEHLTKTLTRIHLIFMAFFFFGYIFVLFSFLNKIQLASTLFVAVIFFFGAVFVTMGIVIQRRMITELGITNSALHENNEKLKREQKQLLNLNTKLQDEIKNRVKAEKADQLKSDFLSVVSHELRTPLTSIFGFTKLIKKGIANLEPTQEHAAFEKKKDRLADNLNIICNECERLTRLINNFLDLAKIESGQMVWIDKPNSLHQMVQSSISSTEGLLLSKPDVEIETTVPQDLPKILVDSDHFTLLLVNLITNAIKFTDKGLISITAKMSMENLVINIADHGQGISLENVNDVFDKFFIVRSGDTLGGKQMGTGLGLPICKEIVAHYNGKIWVESEPHVGSTFTIELPKTLLSQ